LIFTPLTPLLDDAADAATPADMPSPALSPLVFAIADADVSFAAHSATLPLFRLYASAADAETRCASALPRKMPRVFASAMSAAAARDVFRRLPRRALRDAAAARYLLMFAAVDAAFRFSRPLQRATPARCYAIRLFITLIAGH